MNRDELIKSAITLNQVSQECAAEYREMKEILADLMNRKMCARPDCSELVGENNIEMMKDNHANHVRFMESIFTQFSPEVFTDTVLWVFRAYRARHFGSAYWSAAMNSWIEICREELSETCFKAIYPYYQWMQVHIPAFNTLAEQNPEGSTF
jgi:hypothetical protein